MKVGVFDSGIGGLSVVGSIEKSLPGTEVVFASDPEHMPYGDKPPAQVLGYVLPILQGLVAKGCQVLVIACNTVTTHHIAALRARLPVPVVGIEPMVKPAAAVSKSGIIAVCATPATLASERYAWLKRTYAAEVRVIEPDCSRWAYMIERNRSNELQLDKMINEVCEQGADVIVLGCTHYHWIEQDVRKVAGSRALVIQPEQAVIKRLWRVMAELGQPA